MALQIGQKRNIDFNNFRTQLSITPCEARSRNIFGTDGQGNVINSWYAEPYFTDLGFRKQGGFLTQEIYYLTLVLQRQTEELSFNIKLQTNPEDYQISKPYQILKKCVLNAKVEDENNPDAGKYDYYDLVIVSNNNSYNTLVLSINRTAQDILSTPRTIASSAATIHLYSLENLVDFDSQKYWKKMGIQSRPGSLIVVNKEPIRIGRSGIYELNNGTKITNLMIASGWRNGEAGETINTNVDPFLVDYVYQTNENGG